MTYKELLNQLSQLNKEQLNQDVSIYVCEHNEYYGIGVELIFVGDEGIWNECPIISVL